MEQRPDVPRCETKLSALIDCLRSSPDEMTLIPSPGPFSCPVLTYGGVAFMSGRRLAVTLPKYRAAAWTGYRGTLVASAAKTEWPWFHGSVRPIAEILV